MDLLKNGMISQKIKKADCGNADCPLYIEFKTSAGCGNCPVKSKAKQDYCKLTPYRDWHNFWENQNTWNLKISSIPWYHFKERKLARKLAIAERDFLIKLKEEILNDM